MGTLLRALIIEDSDDDAALLLRHLRLGGYDLDVERVESAAAMGAALERRPWDIVISDFSMPGFGAQAALEVLKATGFDIPFIVVSGTVGEETAVEIMRAGVHDFVLKGKLARLVPAIERELRDAAVRAERRKMQEQLLLSDRMASIGTLAAGVAHEINNPLAVIVANLDFVSAELGMLDPEPGAAPDASAVAANLAASVEDVHESLRHAREAAERVRLIVRDLKMFSRADEERRGPVDVRRVLESSLRMAGNEIRHRARLLRDYRDVPLVLANEARLGQVFLNLFVNAAQAIPEGNAEQNEIQIATRLEPGDRVVVEVRDTGSGIPPDVVPRIFDPFFTTKPIGVGTGLGLAICHRIVTALGGEIAVESQVGVGTVFRTSLPVARTAELTNAAVATVATTGRRGRVLVVDDEVLLGVAVRRTLGPEHDVTVLTAAREALEAFARGDRFDVILCDLMMPDMTGMDLHAALERRAPDQCARIVFLTGGAFTHRARAFLDHVTNVRIEKPFDPENLRALIRDRLR